MTHLAFILWMLLYPILETLREYINCKRKLLIKEKELEFTEDVIRKAEMVKLIIWFFIGWLVY